MVGSACTANPNDEPKPGESSTTALTGTSTQGATGVGNTTDAPTSTESSTTESPTSTGNPQTGENPSTTGATTSPEDTTTAQPVADMGPPPVTCPATAFCEGFEDYTETALVDGQTFGPWKAAVKLQATMDLDGTHTTSGQRALHVRLEEGDKSGGRLLASDGVALLADSPTHVYGRMMMYTALGGTSVHWTFFGVSGPPEPSTPPPANYASYIMSSLPKDGVNMYSFVDGLGGGQDYQDCSKRADVAMPVGQWSCVSFEMDSVARKLRMWVDGDPNPIVAVDEVGAACVAPLPADSLWYGPLIDQLFVGAWSFHPMKAPLELWIDDLVVDTAPVACP